MNQTEDQEKSVKDQSLAEATEDQGCDTECCDDLSGCFDDCCFVDECCC